MNNKVTIRQKQQFLIWAIKITIQQKQQSKIE